MAKGYRIGYPEQTTAWSVLEFEYEELGKVHILNDMFAFLRRTRVYQQISWRTTLAEFRRLHDDKQGVWLCPSLMEALTHYGRYYGDDPVILEYAYESRNVVSNLGPDGFFVLDPQFVRERGVDPLEPLKRDMSRLFGRRRR